MEALTASCGEITGGIFRTAYNFCFSDPFTGGSPRIANRGVWVPLEVEDMDLAFPYGVALKPFNDRDHFTERGLALMEVFHGPQEGCGIVV